MGNERAVMVVIRDCKAAPVQHVDDSSSPGPAKGNSAYDAGYQTGLQQGREHVDSYKQMGQSGKKEFRKTYLGILARFEREYRDVAQSYGENHSATQQKKGIADGYRQALEDGSIR
jgi:hypothetical protein